MKAKSFIFALFAVAVCFYGCESTSLDEQQDDSSTTVLPEGKQNPDGDGDDDDEVVELPELPDLEDVDDVCTKMTDLDFMSYCYKNFDVNGDAKVSMSEANAVKKISCSTAEDFTGIQYFSNLESFESYSAKILDLRYSAKLTSINFYVDLGSSHRSAPIEELDLRYCIALTEIGKSAFRACTMLTAIELPSSLTYINQYAFYVSSSLTSVDFPASLTSIGSDAFGGCSLTSVDFPASLTSIDSHAFYNCGNLETVISRAVTPPSIGISVFSYCSSLITLYVPSESVDAYKNSNWAEYFSEILPL